MPFQHGSFMHPIQYTYHDMYSGLSFSRRTPLIFSTNQIPPNHSIRYHDITEVCGPECPPSLPSESHRSGNYLPSRCRSLAYTRYPRYTLNKNHAKQKYTTQRLLYSTSGFVQSKLFRVFVSLDRKCVCNSNTLHSSIRHSSSL